MRDEIEFELRTLARALRAIPEPAMRREYLLERLEGGDLETAHELLAAILGEEATPGEPLRETALGVLRSGGATREFPYELRADLYALAHDHGDSFLMRVLRSAEAAQVLEDPSAELHAQLAEIPLGTRRSLARGDDPNVLERLLLDGDVTVITHLLENPRIVEAQVVRIAARRPVAASTLRAIERSRRFGTRNAVRRALARNPYCPTELALLLLGGLSAPELDEIAADETLHPTLRLHAREERQRRSPRDAET
jgi:hypothetical protein